MWIRLHLSKDRIVYIALCYFPPKGSKFAKGEALEEVDRSDEDSGDGMEEDGDDEAKGPSTQSPYSALSKSIMEYSRLRELLLTGDFNARTRSRQCDTYDTNHPEMMHRIQDEDIGTMRTSADTGPDSTGYGRHP